MFQNSLKTKRGECDCCGKVDIDIYPTHHNMSMCAVCRDAEMAAIDAASKVKALANVSVVEASRKIDTLVELKADIYNAETVPFIALQASIESDESIPSARKRLALADEVKARLDAFNKAIFDDEAALMVKRNQRQAWLVHMQNVAAGLHESERAKYKQHDVNYKPTVVKSVKPKVVKPSPKKFSKAELYAAATKYGVPAPAVQAWVTARGISCEDAARTLAEQMGLI